MIYLLHIMICLIGESTSSNGTSNSCHGSVCIPSDYNRLENPNTKNFSIFVTLSKERKSTSKRSFKDIDLKTMMLRLEPKVVIAWQDERLFVEDSNKSVRLDMSLMDQIWTPNVVVQHRAIGDKSMDKSAMMDITRSGMSYLICT